jgi:hypothetical protein
MIRFKVISPCAFDSNHSLYICLIGLTANPNCTERGQGWHLGSFNDKSSNSRENSYVSDLKQNTLLGRNILKIFLSFWHDIKKWQFDIHFDLFSSEVRQQRHSANPPPFPLGFTAIIDCPRAWEVPPGCGPKSGTAPVRIPISFQSWATQNVGVVSSH